MDGIIEIYQMMNGIIGTFFEYVKAHPRYAFLFVAALLSLLLVGLLLGWKWALHWQNNGKLWIFDDCTSGTKRRILIVLTSIALIGCIMMFFVCR